MQIEMHIPATDFFVDKHLTEGGHTRLIAELKGSNGVKESQRLRGECDDTRLWDPLLSLV